MDPKLIYAARIGLVEGDQPPTEFRLFSRGVNRSTKGDHLLDGVALAACLAAWRAGGVDLPIDLEHDSLSHDARAARSDAGDARGWFRLADRGGELWAVDVTWTPDGVRRLSERTQRYISPAFRVDENDRVVEIVNVALCSMPATIGAVPLVASKSADRDARILALLGRVVALATAKPKPKPKPKPAPKRRPIPTSHGNPKRSTPK